MPKRIKSSDIKISGVRKLTSQQADILINSVRDLTDDQKSILKNILTSDRAISTLGLSRNEAVTKLADEINKDSTWEAVETILRDRGFIA